MDELFRLEVTLMGMTVHPLACRHLVEGIASGNWVLVFAAEPVVMCQDCACLAAEMVAVASTPPTNGAAPKTETPK